jgi:acetylornithine deacetylase/succinyl-diaminopimelate desuccinylase-like protein
MSTSIDSSLSSKETLARVDAAVDRERLVRTALTMMRQPSPTGQAGAAADALAGLLESEGLTVQRVSGEHPDAPAVVVRLDSERPGRCLQFDGHLDTVHIPYVPPQVADDQLTGSGACDMKGGIAAAAEALLALRDSGSLTAGSVLLTAHDLHECPWGDGHQLENLIREGHVGDGVLLPEYYNASIPLAGRGGLIWTATVSRPGPAIHEVCRPAEPSVIAAAAELVARLGELDGRLSALQHPLAGVESVFVGQIHAGTIYNEYAHECRVQGTRRWLPGRPRSEVEAELRELVAGVARHCGTTIELQLQPIRDAFHMDAENPLIDAFQTAFASQAEGKKLPTGGKPFVDDGNVFASLAGIPAITHGANSGGAHTIAEWASITDLVRVAKLYARTALAFCAA